VTVNIDEGLLRRFLDELYAVGSYRPLYSDAWAVACNLVEGWMKDAGLAVRRDAVGNLWGRIEGKGTAVVTGSHIDTVRNGGRLDGALAISAGLVAIRALIES